MLHSTLQAFWAKGNESGRINKLEWYRNLHYKEDTETTLEYYNYVTTMRRKWFLETEVEAP